jgi:hypothetical protein
VKTAQAKELQDAWGTLARVKTRLNGVEKRVRAFLQAPEPAGRLLPYFESAQASFLQGAFEPVPVTLVQTSNRQTKITRLSLDVYIRLNNPELQRADVYPLRPSPTGMFNRFTGLPAATTAGVAMFDFDWTFTLGSTERRYTNGRVETDGLWNARTSLGNQERDSQLLFSPRNPLVVEASEFLTFWVRPTLYNPAAEWVPLLTPVDIEYVVAIQCVGTRTFTYDT